MCCCFLLFLSSKKLLKEFSHAASRLFGFYKEWFLLLWLIFVALFSFQRYSDNRTDRDSHNCSHYEFVGVALLFIIFFLFLSQAFLLLFFAKSKHVQKIKILWLLYGTYASLATVIGTLFLFGVLYIIRAPDNVDFDFSRIRFLFFYFVGNALGKIGKMLVF